MTAKRKIQAKTKARTQGKPTQKPKTSTAKPTKKGKGDHKTDEPGHTTTTNEEQIGCIRCAGDPVPAGDLSNKIAKDGLTLMVDCDATWRQMISYRIDWKNANQGGATYIKDTSIQDGHASAYFRTETFDAFCDTIQKAIGRIMSLPSSLTANGLKSVDNIIRNFRDEMNALLNGKEDMDVLTGEVNWKIEVRERCRLKVTHFQKIEGFVQTGGLWNFDARVTINGNKSDDNSDLPILSDADRTALKRPGANANIQSASLSTNLKQDFRDNKFFTVNPGKLTVSTSYVLIAGFEGVLTQANITQINNLINSANKAIDDFVTLANSSPTGPALTAGAKKLLEDAAKVASDALSAIIALLNTLVNEVIGYIKLHRSILTLECAGHGIS